MNAVFAYFHIFDNGNFIPVIIRRNIKEKDDNKFNMLTSFMILTLITASVLLLRRIPAKIYAKIVGNLNFLNNKPNENDDAKDIITPSKFESNITPKITR